MIVAVYGLTDKRPVIYTLMKLLQRLGDTCLVSDDRHFKRLLDDPAMTIGHYQNTLIAVTDATPDEVFEEIGYSKIDFEHMIFDNTIPDDADVVIYVEGCAKSELETETLEYLDKYETIGIGHGKNSVSYSINMLKNVELIEGKKFLCEVDRNITKKIATILSPILNMPVSNIIKVVSKR